MIVIGTSLQVMPFAGLVERVSRSTPRLLINREAVGPFEYLRHNRTRGSDSLWLGDADDGVRALVEELGWAEEFDEICQEGEKRLRADWHKREAVAREPEEVDSGAEEEDRGAEEEDSGDEKEGSGDEKEGSEAEKEEERAKSEDNLEDKDKEEAPARETGEEDEAVQKLSELIESVAIDKPDTVDPKAKA